MDFAKYAEERKAFEAWRAEHPQPLIWVMSVKALFRDYTPPSPELPFKFGPHSYVYIGRHAGMHEQSPLANPFKLHGEHTRPQVLTQYRGWLQTQLDGQSEVWKELMKILAYALEPNGIALGCWCAPKPCHGGIIRECIYQMYQEGWRP